MNRMLKSSSSTLVSLACSAMPALAVTDAEFEALQRQLNALAERVQTLEADNAALRQQLQADDKPGGVLVEQTVSQTSVETAPAAVAAVEPQLTQPDEKLFIKGDFRYRYESTNVERQKRRDRDRIRARMEVIAQLSPSVVVGTGIATGGTDPVSANQTLGQGGTRKDLDLNLAYARWQPTDEAFLAMGKMKNSFYRPQGSGLLWDSDYTPEGIAAGWQGDYGFAVGALYWLESDSRLSDHQAIVGAQIGLKLDLNHHQLTTGVGYYNVPVAGNSSYYGDPDAFYGNSYRCDDFDSADECFYRYDYEELEWFADYTLKVFPVPVNVYIDYVQNLAVDRFDSGWLFGISAGSLKKRGQWEFGYEYQDLDADAAFGLLSDSDFAAGGTDGRGHHLFGGYALSDRVHLDLTWYINNKFGGDRLARALDYDRVMVDAVFVY